MTVTLHHGDIPAELDFGNAVAVDTETLGLKPHRDELCVVQLSAGDGTAHIVQINRSRYNAPYLKSLLNDPAVTKIFHYARFDLAMLMHYLEVMAVPVYCTKIASRLARTYTDRHSLKDLCRELLNVDLSKQQQSSDWGAEALDQAQINYAASDVLHLHNLRDALEIMLVREGRQELTHACFDFLPTRARLDLAGWEDEDIFSHSTRR
ncbi:MAG: ribonuclease H-like domain-containing protein [Parvularculales bacterium]